MNESKVQQKVDIHPEIMVFKNNEFGTIRTVSKNGEPWFVAVDVCKALDIGNNRQALNRLDDDEKADVILSDISSNGVLQKRTFSAVNESGLYALVLSSRKPDAKQFKRWITHEVIPSIRKHGAYLTESVLDEVISHPEAILALAQQLLEEREQRIIAQEKLRQVQPKADYFDAFVNKDDATSVRTTAKELGIPQNTFVRKLICAGYLYRDRAGRLMPYAQYAEQGKGFFMVRDVYKTNGDLIQWTLVTCKGKEHIRARLFPQASPLS